MAILKTLLAR